MKKDVAEVVLPEILKIRFEILVNRFSCWGLHRGIALARLPHTVALVGESPSVRLRRKGN